MRCWSRNSVFNDGESIARNIFDVWTGSKIDSWYFYDFKYKRPFFKGKFDFLLDLDYRIGVRGVDLIVRKRLRRLLFMLKSFLINFAIVNHLTSIYILDKTLQHKNRATQKENYISILPPMAYKNRTLFGYASYCWTISLTREIFSTSLRLRWTVAPVSICVNANSVKPCSFTSYTIWIVR